VIFRYESTRGESVVIGVTMVRCVADGSNGSCESEAVAVGLVSMGAFEDVISDDTNALVRFITCKSANISESNGSEVRSCQWNARSVSIDI
jgi:hypothetical protein